jgi:hydrogenase maturation protease
MSGVLVAGIGNVFRGDDGFGPAVLQRLLREPLPAGVRGEDFGVRCLHLAFELLDGPAALVVVDLVSRGGAPGTLYVIDPDAEALPPATADAHGMDLPAVLAAARTMGAALPPVRLVGCEPASLGDVMELSAPVRRAVAPAVALVRRLVLEPFGRPAHAGGAEPAVPPGPGGDRCS